MNLFELLKVIGEYKFENSVFEDRVTEWLERNQIDSKKLIQRITNETGNQMILVSGSISDGYANEFSDLDIYSITDKDCCEFVWIPGENGKRIDVELISLSRLINAYKKIELVKNIDNTGLFVSKEILKMVYRTKVSINMGGQHLPSEVDNFELKSLSLYLCRRNTSIGDNTYQDSLGALRSKQYEQAYLMAKKTLEFTIDAYLNALGDANPQEKFRYFKLKRACSSNKQLQKLLTCFESVFLFDQRDSNLRKKTEAVLDVSQVMLSVCHHYIRENTEKNTINTGHKSYRS